jgi:hypothetical protein
MGVEAFIYPFLILISALVSMILAACLRKIFGAKYGVSQFLLVAVAAPSTVLFLSVRDPAMVWEYVAFSSGLSAVASWSVAIFYAWARMRK